MATRVNRCHLRVSTGEVARYRRATLRNVASRPHPAATGAPSGTRAEDEGACLQTKKGPIRASCVWAHLDQLVHRYAQEFRMDPVTRRPRVIHQGTLCDRRLR